MPYPHRGGIHEAEGEGVAGQKGGVHGSHRDDERQEGAAAAERAGPLAGCGPGSAQEDARGHRSQRSSPQKWRVSWRRISRRSEESPGIIVARYLASYSSRVQTGRAGIPAETVRGGTSFVTTLFAPTMLSGPIVTPGRSTAPVPDDAVVEHADGAEAIAVDRSALDLPPEHPARPVVVHEDHPRRHIDPRADLDQPGLGAELLHLVEQGHLVADAGPEAPQVGDLAAPAQNEPHEGGAGRRDESREPALRSRLRVVPGCRSPGRVDRAWEYGASRHVRLPGSPRAGVESRGGGRRPRSGRTPRCREELRGPPGRGRWRDRKG